MNEFLKFQKMIAPIIIQVLFWIAIVVNVIFAFITMFSTDFWLGLVILILGPIIIRLYFELLIVIFKIYETLREIKDK
jgi:uncharacterized integral membrane protein